jgi:hypothetical protein
MLEILLLRFLCIRMGELVRNKGQSPLLYQVMLVVFWFGGEFFGGMAAGAAQALRGEGAGVAPFDLSIYFAALVGAACGGGLAFLVAFLLPSETSEDGAGPGYEVVPSETYNPYAPPRTH